MTIKVGDKVPSVTLRYLTPEGVKAVTADEFFAGKKVALFAVPGRLYPHLLAAASAELCHERGRSSRPRASTRSPASRSTTRL